MKNKEKRNSISTSVSYHGEEQQKINGFKIPKNNPLGNIGKGFNKFDDPNLNGILNENFDYTNNRLKK